MTASSVELDEPGSPASGGRPIGSSRKRGPELEDAILEAAYQELSEVGYTAFTVESVAARARTGKASIYRRWPTKADVVLDALVTRLPTPAQCGMDMQWDDSVSTADALRRLAVIISEVLSSSAGCAMRAIKCEAVTDPELARAIDERFQAPRRAAMLALLERGERRGEVRPEAVSPVIADVLPAVLSHRIILQREAISAAEITQVIDEVILPLIAPR